MPDPTTTTPAPTDHDAAQPRLALRPREAARALGIGQRKLWEITADKSSGIPHARFGKAVVYPLDMLRVWLAQQAKRGDR